MKKCSFKARILIPIMAVLMLFPPMSYFIFSQTANKYAIDSARDDLTLLRESLVPLIDESFTGSGEPREEVSTFLKGIGPLMANTDGSARLMILGSRMQIIYPRDEESRKAAEPLSESLAEIVKDSQMPDTLEFDDETYLLEIYKTPEKTPNVRYIITYCPASKVGEWVNSAAKRVLVISAILAVSAFVILWFATNGITRSLKRLCRESERIGGGNFEKIEPPFGTPEFEELRVAMNGMSAHLEHSDEAQRNFFQNVSHELRNPLMSISGYAQGIEEGIFPDPKYAAHTILEESARLTELVSGLLNLSRLETGETNIALESVPIIDVIEDSVDRMSGFALQKNILINIKPFDRSIEVYGDEELSEKILDNLISNAVRYAKNSVNISVLCENNMVSVTVSDDGDGISADDLPHIFERGYKGNGGNFGIGLTIARSAAEKMHGSLSAKNSPSGGAAFTLKLMNFDSVKKDFKN